MDESLGKHSMEFEHFDRYSLSMVAIHMATMNQSHILVFDSKYYHPCVMDVSKDKHFVESANHSDPFDLTEQSELYYLGMVARHMQY